MVKGGSFSDFFLFFLNIALVIFEISVACGHSFYAIVPKNYDGNKYISFEDLHYPRV